jgi:hypothetical protein
MYVFIFKEFIGLEKLKQFTNKIKIPNEFVNQIKDENSTEILETNIKIFFENEPEEAYKLKETLEINNVATFITDQLTTTIKRNGQEYICNLPKDRIIMKLI